MNVETWIRRFHQDARPIGKRSETDLIMRGFYPAITLNKNVDRQLWCSSYISTYLERDIRNLTQIGDLSQFERFVRLCASRTGQILNLSEMARDLGISVPTAKRWISILETGYQVYLLPPYYKNIGKRLVKSPKLYFTDTALATYLLGLHDRTALAASPSFGNLFETMIISDVLKRYMNSGVLPSMYYMRTRDGLEVDLALESGGRLHFLEIKSAMTITKKHASSLFRASGIRKLKLGNLSLISRAKTSMNFSGQRKVACRNWRACLSL
jgi:uncharacterized protein